MESTTITLILGIIIGSTAIVVLMVYVEDLVRVPIKSIFHYYEPTLPTYNFMKV